MNRLSSIRFGGPMTKALKYIIIINVVVYVFQMLLPFVVQSEMLSLTGIFGISYDGINNHYYWQFLTYGFFHSSNPLHILLNMFSLWIFGGDLENYWGSRKFVLYYLTSVAGAGLFIHLMNIVAASKGFSGSGTRGASGGVFGILLAYGMTWPNREVLLYFLFPVKMKYFVIIFGLIEFFGTLQSFSFQTGNISHIGHLGGLITGFTFIMIGRIKSKSKNVKRKISRAKFTVVANQNKAKNIIDELLDKIAREGMASLSSEERKKLEWARKNYYPDPDEKFH